MEEQKIKSGIKLKIEQIKIRAKTLKRDVKALYIACKRPEMPWYAKLLAILVVGYALSPVDLIPDFIPVLGYLDDFILLPLGIWMVVRLVPRDLMEGCRKQAEEQPEGTKVKSWTAGIFIVLIWTIIATLLIVKFLI